MNKKNQIKVLSVAIACSFFLPIFTWHNFEMSGLNFILSSHIDSYKYLLLGVFIPAFFLFTDMKNEHSLFFSTKTLCCLPLVSLVTVLIVTCSSEKAEFAFYGVNNFLSLIDIGFWPILIFSSFLMFAGFQKKVEKQYA